MAKNQKTMAALLSIAAMTTHMSQPFSTPNVFIDIPKDPKKVIPNGCKEYTFHGITVIAMNEKSARKKAIRQLKENVS